MHLFAGHDAPFVRSHCTFSIVIFTEQRAVAEKLKFLAKNPFHPSLRTKKLQRLEDVFESSVNMDIRILWMHKGDRIILLIDTGHHDILP